MRSILFSPLAVLVLSAGCATASLNRAGNPAAVGPGVANAPGTDALCTNGESSGGFILNRHVEVSYTATYGGDSAQIGAVFLGRSRQAVGGSDHVLERPVLPGSPAVSGGTIGSWFLMYEPARNVAWVQTREVPLGDFNVVLLDDIMAASEPRMVGMLRVPPRFPTGGRCDLLEFGEAVQEHLLRNPEIRAFVAEAGRWP